MNAYSWFNLDIANYYDGTSAWGIPQLLEQHFDLPVNMRLKAYRRNNYRDLVKDKDVCHFFIEDDEILTAFSSPKSAVKHLQRYYATLEPNYSIYSDWPIALSILNTYRTRWCGRYWQEQGLKVIPTVVWGLPNTYGFCFDGVPRGATIALRPPPNFGKYMKKREVTEYLDGLSAMQSILRPARIIAFGKLEKFIKRAKVITVESKRKDSNILYVI